MTAPDSLARVRRIFTGYAGLYAPSVIEEAAALLDALVATAEEHGHDRQSEATGWLTTAAAEATSSKYRRHGVDRSHTEVIELVRTLTTELTELGLTIVPAQGRNMVAVAPVPTGPSWGLDGRTGLAVALYTDGGWDLTVNQRQTRVHSIYAPATADGAREVAAIVHGIAHGDVEDPFRRRD